jgi:hypothetical protein
MKKGVYLILTSIFAVLHCQNIVASYKKDFSDKKTSTEKYIEHHRHARDVMFWNVRKDLSGKEELLRSKHAQQQKKLSEIAQVESDQEAELSSSSKLVPTTYHPNIFSPLTIDTNLDITIFDESAAMDVSLMRAKRVAHNLWKVEDINDEEN